jgi:DNA-directed RNA polymerase beta subunit
MPKSRYFLSDFVSIQRQSFFTLLEKGLIEEWNKRNPITNAKKDVSVLFYPEYYILTRPFYTEREAILKNKSYTSQLFIPVQIKNKNQKKITLKWVYIGNIPLMTKRGHFILNGAARVIVNQILRSPGIYYQQKLYSNFNEKGEALRNNDRPADQYKRYYADIICMRGTWLRLLIDKEKNIWAQMKKGPKIPIYWFLLAMGISEKMIFKSITEEYRLLGNLEMKLKENLTTSSSSDIKNLSQGKTPTGRGKQTYPYLKYTSSALKEIYSLTRKKTKGFSVLTNSFLKEEGGESNIDELSNDKLRSEESLGKKKNPQSEVTLSPRTRPFSQFNEKGLQSIQVNRENPNLSSKNSSLNPRITSTARKASPEGTLRTRNLTNLGRKWFYNRFMNPRSYDLGKNGRLALNRKLGLSISPSQLTLTGLDVLYATDYLIKVEKGQYKIDDIDHLKNRRVRTSGELIQMQIGVGLVRLEKHIRDGISQIVTRRKTQNTSGFSSLSKKSGAKGTKKQKNKRKKSRIEESITEKESLMLNTGLNAGITLTPYSTTEGLQLNTVKKKMKNRTSVSFIGSPYYSLFNNKPFNSAIREFFGTSPLSQFMDQMNPLAELTHKRRLSSMGPGGVTRDSATLAIRGIHPTHYGRICPIETPEGKNTGLVSSMTAYARVNPNGIIESPVYSVYKGLVQKNTGMYYFSAEQEEKIQLAAADLFISPIGFLPSAKIPVRSGEDFTKTSRQLVSFISVSPLQMISIATSLIPFLEHDDANRALMGSNMQRQAVPLIRPSRPIVGTGLEARAVSDSGHVLQSQISGLVTYASSSKIVIYHFKEN